MSLFCESSISLFFLHNEYLFKKYRWRSFQWSTSNNKQCNLSSNEPCSTLHWDELYIPSVDDFCLWYNARSALLDVIDLVMAMDETAAAIVRQIPSTNTGLSLPRSNPIQRRRKRPKTSIAIQTSCDPEQRRNAKVQANTITLLTAQQTNLSYRRTYFSIKTFSCLKR